MLIWEKKLRFKRKLKIKIKKEKNEEIEGEKRISKFWKIVKCILSFSELWRKINVK